MVAISRTSRNLRDGPVGFVEDIGRLTEAMKAKRIQPSSRCGGLLLGPSGLCYDSEIDLLYLASSADNANYAIADASHSERRRHRGAFLPR